MFHHFPSLGVLGVLGVRGVLLMHPGLRVYAGGVFEPHLQNRNTHVWPTTKWKNENVEMENMEI